MKRRKLELGEKYNWTDYISLSFTQNVSLSYLNLPIFWLKKLRKLLKKKKFCFLLNFIFDFFKTQTGDK